MFWTVVLGLQGDSTSPSWRRPVLGVHWRDWCWSWNSNILATWYEDHVIWSHNFMTNRWGNKGNSDRLYFLGSQNCHEIKRHLLFGRKAMINLDSILKSRDITLLTKIHIVKAVVFPVVTYGCESWTIKKAEHQRIDAFEEKTSRFSLPLISSSF